MGLAKTVLSSMDDRAKATRDAFGIEVVFGSR